MIVIKMAVVVVHHMAMSSVTLHCVAINSISQDVVDAVTVSMRSNAIVIVDMNIWLSYVIHYNIVGDTVEEIDVYVTGICFRGDLCKYLLTSFRILDSKGSKGS